MEQGTLRACRSLGDWKDLEISVLEILILENPEKRLKLEWNPEATEVPLLEVTEPKKGWEERR